MNKAVVVIRAFCIVLIVGLVGGLLHSLSLKDAAKAANPGEGTYGMEAATSVSTEQKICADLTEQIEYYMHESDQDGGPFSTVAEMSEDELSRIRYGQKAGNLIQMYEMMHCDPVSLSEKILTNRN